MFTRGKACKSFVWGGGSSRGTSDNSLRTSVKIFLKDGFQKILF